MTNSKKSKVGRNEPCPCGSGLKYKRCHGRLQSGSFGPTQEQITKMLLTHEAREAVRQHEQGQGKPIISTESNGYRFTVVGKQLHYSKTHKTFIDFLGSYITAAFGSEWGNAEIAKPLKDRHTILQWYDSICSLQRKYLGEESGKIYSMPENGLILAYYGLAYNLYLLQHNAELQKFLIQRLKRQDSFYPAYYETFVAAWFILAGFTLRLENEQDSSRTHPEFIATRDGISYSVEAKARQPGKEHFDTGNQLYKALSIEAHHPRVVFIDMNSGPDIDIDEFSKGAYGALKGREKKMLINGEPAPSAHVFITNQPYHLALDRTRIQRACLAIGYKIDDFGYAASFPSYTEAYKSQKRYKQLIDVQKAVISYSIPVSFDGELSEFAFGEAKRRFVIGSRVQAEGGISGVIESGIVLEQEKKAYIIIISDDERRHILSAKLSDQEVSAYKTHPETFFGRIQEPGKSTEDPLEIFEFFVKSYRNTPRERLLEFMAKAPNIEQLKLLSDEDLLYYYAEGLTHNAVKKTQK